MSRLQKQNNFEPENPDAHLTPVEGISAEWTRPDCSLTRGMCGIGYSKSGIVKITENWGKLSLMSGLYEGGMVGAERNRTDDLCHVKAVLYH